jgi:hypothetical protein
VEDNVKVFLDRLIMATEDDEEPRGEEEEEEPSSTTETDYPPPQAQFKKRTIKRRITRRRSEETPYLVEVEEDSVERRPTLSNRKRKYDRGVPFHMETHIKSSSDGTEPTSRFIPHQETEEDRWKLKSGGGLILQFTPTQQEGSDSSREPKER